MRKSFFIVIFALTLAVLVSCGSTTEPNTEPPNETPNETPIEPENPVSNKADYNSFSSNLPSWSEFSPLKETADGPIDDEEVATLEELVGETTYDCTVTPYSLTQTPDEIVTFDPDSNILWVGSLLQGKGYEEGIGSLRELPIRERAPLTISIDLLSDNNTRTIENPDLASVQQAIGELVQAATDSEIKAGSSVSFSQKDAHSVEQAALSLGLSARYMGFTVSSSLEASRSADEKTVTAYFVQKMFTVSMVLPQTPAAVFGDAFTQEVLTEQVNLGNISQTNIPTYVSNIVYGRILSFSFTSTASETDIKATLSATYEGVSGGGSADLSVEQKKILQEAEIGVVTVGGEGKDALAIIRSGDLKAYFEEDAALTSAKPISYTVRNLGDNSIAKVSETTEYNIRECTARPPEAIKPIGASYTVTLNTLRVEESGGSCDPGSQAEVFYQFAVNDNIVSEKSSSDAVDITFGDRYNLTAEPVLFEILDETGGTLKIDYTVREQDGGSANDLIANVSETYTHPNITAGTFNSSPAPIDNCKVTLNYTVAKRPIYSN